MNDKIKSIVVSYENGSTESFSEQLIDKLSKCQGDRPTLSEFIIELLNLLDIESEKEKLQNKFDDKFEKQNILHKQKTERAVNLSKSVIKGLSSQKWFPFMTGYPYKDGDVIQASHPFDYIVLDGLMEMNINKIVFQEVKSGSKSHSLNNDNERTLAKFIHELNSDKVKFEHWARLKDDEPFKLVLHPNLFDETSEPEYRKIHSYCSKCSGWYLTNGHHCFNPPPVS